MREEFPEEKRLFWEIAFFLLTVAAIFVWSLRYWVRSILETTLQQPVWGTFA